MVTLKQDEARQQKCLLIFSRSTPIDKQQYYNDLSYLSQSFIPIIIKSIRMIKLILSILLLTAIHSQMFKMADMVETVSFANRISTPLFTSADCFQGVLQSETDSSAQQARSSYYACFYPQSGSCGNYAKCYDGWIANYTVSGAGTTEGYPSGVTPYPVFNFKVNSAADFLITRDDSLSPQLKDIIATACRSFDPTVTAPVTSAILASASSSSSKRLLIASAPSLLRGDTLALNSYEKLYIASYSFSAKAGAANIQVATAPVQSIALDNNVKLSRSNLERYLEFDTTNNLVRQKNEIYSLAVRNGENGDFNIKTTHTLSYKGRQLFDSASLSRLTGQLRTSLTLQDLQKISRSARPSEFDSFTDVNSQNLGDPSKSQQVVLDIQKQLLSLNPTTTSTSTGAATSSNFFSPKTSPVPAPTTDFFTSPFSGFGRNRLLLDQVIFSQTRTIFSTYVFGFSNTLQMTVTATLVNKFYLRTTAVITITRFNAVPKIILVYDRTQYVGNSFSFSQTISGNWNFGVSIPISGVPFVSSIYLQFSTGYSATASLSGYGVLNLPAFKYTYNYVGNATFQNTFNAIAAVDIWHLIQVGVNGNGAWDKLTSSVPITLEYYWNFNKGKWEIKTTSSWSVVKQAFSFVLQGCWRVWFFGWRPWHYFWPSTISSGYQAINQFLGWIKYFGL